MYLRKYRLQKICLDKCLKSRVSEDALTDNKASRWKYCYDLNYSTITIFINHCEGQ